MRIFLIIILFSLEFCPHAFAKTDVSTVTAPSKEVQLYLANSGIRKLLNASFDRAINWATKDIQELKSSPAQKKQMEADLKLVTSQKEKIILDVSREIESELKIIFSDAELKYLAAQSSNSFFIKLHGFLLSQKLKTYIGAPARHLDRSLHLHQSNASATQRN